MEQMKKFISSRDKLATKLNTIGETFPGQQMWPVHASFVIKSIRTNCKGGGIN